MTAEGILNQLCYAWNRQRWLFRLPALFASNSEPKIRSPIFLLGTHGGGLTLLSRMLRRNEQVLSVTGDHTFWSGADEMQNVLWPLLPPELTGLRHKEPEDEVFGTPRGWLYATNRLLPKYRLTDEDATDEVADRFRRILQWLVDWHGDGVRWPRFTDKSQVFTVKVSFIDQLLDGSKPLFLLVTRNPYAVCYRSAKGKAGGLAELDDSFTFDDKLEIATQHWANSMRCALDDGQTIEGDRFDWIRFEDLLREPEETLQAVCGFADLSYDRDMLPQPHHEMPLGSRFRDRWYPLRPEVNEKYLAEMSAEQVETIDARCARLADRFGYERPS